MGNSSTTSRETASWYIGTCPSRSSHKYSPNCSLDCKAFFGGARVGGQDVGSCIKNLYELLGNNHDEDSDKEPEPPVKVIDKTPARTTKRNAPAEAPASKAPAATEGRGGRRGGFN